MPLSFSFKAAGGASTGWRDAAQQHASAYAAQSETRIARVHTAAMRTVIAGYKAELQADVAAGGFYNAARLAKTWRGVVYPSSTASMEPAGLIWTKAGAIIDAFTYGETIVAHNARFLAIPTGPAKAIVRRLNADVARGAGRDAGGRFQRQASYVERVAQELGVKLEVHVDPRTGRGVIVAPGVRLKGSLFRRAGKTVRQAASGDTVLFLLVRQATLKRRIRGRELLAEFGQRFPADIAAAIAAEIDRS